MKITALLRKLTAIPGVSGREAVVSQPLLELLKENTMSTKMGA